MTVKEFFYFTVSEGDEIYIKVNDTVWNGEVYEVDPQGISIDEKQGYLEWVSFDDMEDWLRREMMVVRLNGVEKRFFY